MKHQTPDQLRAVAEVDERYPNTLSRTERLIRWAERLESNPNRRLFTLHQTEYQSVRIRDEMRGDDTPISSPFEIRSFAHPAWRTTPTAKRSGSSN